MNKKLTIFTPTYNRAHTLPALYQSLSAQDSHDFHWLVIDDGSTDNTDELIRQWKEEKKIEITYIYQENSGKTRAHNRAVQLCQTPLFVCVDSDDILASPTAVSDSLNFWNDHAALAERSDVSGMVSYKKMVNGTNAEFPDGMELSTLAGLYAAGFKGEANLLFKTEVLRHYLFPEIEGEKFVTEDYVHNQLDQTYQLLLFPHTFQLCEYRSDGFTWNAWDVLFKNPKGYRMYYNQLVELGKGARRYNMQMYIACSLLAGDGKTFSECSSKGLLLLLFPLGIWQYFKLRRRKW